MPTLKASKESIFYFILKFNVVRRLAIVWLFCPLLSTILAFAEERVYRTRNQNQMATMIFSARCIGLFSSSPGSPNGAALKSMECSPVNFAPKSLPSIFMQQKQAKLYGPTSYKSPVSVHAEYNGSHSRETGGDGFLGGFLLGGMVFGTLGYLFAPQISKSLRGEDEDGLRKKLAKIVDDDDQGLETTRKTLNEKIAQLNSAIDDVSAQLRAEDSVRGSIAGVPGVESAV